MNTQGFCKPGFEGVQAAFEANFDKGAELGASVAVTLDGEPVVDLWGGDADPQGAPWAKDTLVNVYSTTKTMAAFCILILADRGEIDLQAPVADPLTFQAPVAWLSRVDDIMRSSSRVQGVSAAPCGGPHPRGWTQRSCSRK